jgi:hypothetical protein
MNELPTIAIIRDIAFNIAYKEHNGKLDITYESEDKQHKYTFTVDISDFNNSKINLMKKEIDKQIAEISEILYSVAFEL